MKTNMTNGHPTPARLLGHEQAQTMFSPEPAHRGLTKREHIAIAMMAAIVAGDPDCDHAAAADDAILYTDALLERLAR